MSGSKMLVMAAFAAATIVGQARAAIYVWDGDTDSSLLNGLNYDIGTSPSNTNATADPHIVRFGLNAANNYAPATGSNFQISGYEFTADSPGFTVSGGTLYAVGGGSSNPTNLVSAAGGSGAHRINALRPRATGSITNNSAGLLRFGNAIGGAASDSLLVNRQSGTGIVELTFDGSGDISTSRISRRTNTYDGNVIKNGAGTLTIDGAAGASGNNVVGVITGTYAINAGTLGIGSNNTIAATSAMTLNGGKFATGGFDNSFTTSLGLTSSSTIDMGALDSVLTYADTSAISWTGTLTIANWSGNPAGGGVDQIIFGNSSGGLNATQLEQIVFSGYEPGVAILANGEVVPTGAAVPEPAALAMLGVVGLLGSRRRR